MSVEEQLETLKKKYEESLQKIEALESKNAKSGSESDWDTDATGDTLQLGGAKPKRVRKKRSRGPKPATLKGVLNRHEHLIKELGNKTFVDSEETANIRAVLNSLSKNTIKEAIKNENSKHATFEQEVMINPPNLESNEGAPADNLKNSIQSLRDVFKLQFAGKPGEDIEGFFVTANKLAEGSKLSVDQYYTLLKSRALMGSTLYNEIKLSEETNSSIKDLMSDVLLVFGNHNNYMLHLNKLNSYKPLTSDEPNMVYAQVKMLTTNLALVARPTCKATFIYQNIKQKLLALYPAIAQQIIEKESALKVKHTSQLARIFLLLAPSPGTKVKPSKDTVFEVTEDTLDDSFATVHVIKISEAIVKKLSGRCYKCASSTHYGRDCKTYAGCQLAYYLCQKCKQAVHLPKDCKQSLEEQAPEEENVLQNTLHEQVESKNLL